MSESEFEDKDKTLADVLQSALKEFDEHQRGRRPSADIFSALVAVSQLRHVLADIYGRPE